MIELDPFILSRIQFATNITFHIMFPSITIALSWILLFFKLRYQATKDKAWMDSYFFFTKVFALSFAIGIVSGITMSFQFGTNWPGFMKTFGNVAGPLLAYEVLTAFFLEASFLGIMLFGFRKVPGWFHTLATFLVALGTTVSAFWILVLNSWMHTPAGYEMIPNHLGEMEAHVTSWLAVIFNPSMHVRLPHMLLASGLCASFLVMGLSGYRMLKGDHAAAVSKSMATGIILASILIPLQIYVGHEHGIHTRTYQPEKIAAIEAAWETKKGAPLILFSVPDETARHNNYEVKIPYLGSLIVTHQLDGELKGLNDFAHHPPVKPLFFGFRVMVGLGMLMMAISWFGLYHIIKKRPLPRYYQYATVIMTFSGVIATVSGWYVTEIGRQPWLVHGVMMSKDALGPVTAAMVLPTLLTFLATYAFLTVAYVFTLFHLARKAGQPKQVTERKQIQSTLIPLQGEIIT